MMPLNIVLKCFPRDECRRIPCWLEMLAFPLMNPIDGGVSSREIIVNPGRSDALVSAPSLKFQRAVESHLLGGPKTKWKRWSSFMLVLIFLLTLSYFCPLFAASEGKPDEQITNLLEARGAVETIYRENLQLRDKLSSAEAAMESLRRHLIASNGEAEIFKRKVLELTMRFEALGLDSLSGQGRIEDRLLKALGDLRRSEQNCERFRNALAELREVVNFRRNLDMDSLMRAVDRFGDIEQKYSNSRGGDTLSNLDCSTSMTPNFSDARIIAYREDLAIVVANIGRKLGAKIGMPCQVRNEECGVANVRIIDVRDNISAAIIQSFDVSPNKIQIGDRLMLICDPK